MPRYRYRARRADGAPVEGVIEAADLDAAAGQLLDGGLIPLALDEQAAEDRPWGGVRAWFGRDRPHPDTLILFSRQCHALLRAGVPIIRGLRLLADSSRDPVFARVIEAISDDLESGLELSVALARHPDVFSPLYVNMVRVGETSGRLDEAFAHLYQYLRRDRETRKQIKAAFRYPAFVLAAIVIAVFILMTFVIPKFAAFYQANHLTLPLPTRIIMAVAGFCAAYWWLILGAAAVAALGWRQWLQTAQGRLWWDEHKLRLPIVGDIALRATLARFCRTLAMALGAGVPVLQAVHVTAQALGNVFLGGKVQDMREHIERGESLLRAAARQGVFTPVVLQMIAVGEESGRIEEMLGEVAGFYEREVDYDVENLNAAIEPLLTVALAGVVLLLMLGIFLPMWNVTELVGR
ncbi:MAG: MSHA biogenesis protein MshG [Gammaproteobacteria bacterium]|nr:MAG: MSHA biogenesis protein MshG [Gammaproteobacteria bacterium]